MNHGPVLRIDERMRSLTWPAPVVAAHLTFQPDDTLLMCSGFEERATWALETGCANGGRRFTLIHLVYQPFQNENRLQVVKALVNGADLDERAVVYDRLHPAGIGERVVSMVPVRGRIFVDISGMSRLLIVQVLVALEKANCLARTIVLYCEPQDYFPSEGEFLAHKCDASEPLSFISTGVYEVAATPELSSVAMQGEAVRLITFPSFNSDQLNALLVEILPTYLDVLYGKPAHSEDAWRLGAIHLCNEQSLKGIGNMSQTQVSSIDYRETLAHLLELYAAHYVFDRILIAPTGTKMQSVAVAFMKMLLDDVQIVYPIPHEFTNPSRYTAGVRSLYQLDLSDICFWKD